MSSKNRVQAFVEIALIFAVFYLQGAWPVPDVNEPHYLGKAIHYWSPDQLRGDFFLESADTHKVFYFTFGWLSLYMSPLSLAWTGRIVTWALLAWAWRRLSIAIAPRPWYSILTAGLFVCLMERCHMAGEWVIGGVEAKGFAYVFVFFGLGSLVRNHWNRALLLFGAAGAFHALVGGWAAVAAGCAWLWLAGTSRREIGENGAVTAESLQPQSNALPPLRNLWPGILLGLLLALPGLLPSLLLNWGIDPKTVQRSHEIYVFGRLPHHLVLTGMRLEFILRLALLGLFWLLLGCWEIRLQQNRAQRNADPPSVDVSPEEWRATRRLRAFITGAITITVVGAALHLLNFVQPGLAADVLRYYWFRLTDVALPLGVAIESIALMSAVLHPSYSSNTTTSAAADGSPHNENKRHPLTAKLQHHVPWAPLLARLGLICAILLSAFHLGDHLLNRLAPVPPRADRLADYEAWRDACAWVSQPQNIPPGACFFTPRLSQTFKWYTGHSEVATWKDVPQDALEIIDWWQRIEELYMTGGTTPETRWHATLAELGPAKLRQLAAKYGARYMICEATPTPLDLPVMYRNRAYVVYRLDNP